MNKDLLFPNNGIFRTIFLYVGQGETTLLIIPDGDKHKYILVDLNIDLENNGKNIKSLLNDIGRNNLIFINTHPHNDHTRGLKEISDIIKEVWHSGHKPGKKNEVSFKELEEIIKKVGEKNVFYLRGSNDSNILYTDRDETSKIVKKIGDIDFQVFSPAKYVCEDIDNETPEERIERIHEQCGVIKFIYKGKSILITGDSNKIAWKNYITNYYKDNLKSDILSAPHHGSRSFFKNKEDDTDVYKDHIKKINPEYLIISAPKQKDSPHNHPHDDALEIYEKYIKKENIYHLGKDEKSMILDIDKNGKIDIYKNDSNLTLKNNIPTIIYETRSKFKPYNPYAD